MGWPEHARRRAVAAALGSTLLLAPLLPANPAAAQTGGAWPPGSARQQAVAPDCPGCWVQDVQARPAAGAAPVAPANPTCYGQPSLDFFRAALAIVAPRTPPSAAGDLATAIRGLSRPMFEALREGSAADFRVLLGLPAGHVPYANCVPLAALLPQGARVRRVEVSVLRGDEARRCDPVGGACGDGGRFVQPPEALSAPATASPDGPAGRQGIGAVFVSAGAGEAARLSVAYQLPSGEAATPLP